MIRVITNQGLGDCIASRPTVAALVRKHGDVFLETSYPEVFADLPCPVVKPRLISIRCAQRNADAFDGWSDAPPGIPEIQLGYVLQPGCRSIPEQIAESAGVLGEVRWDNARMNHVDYDGGTSWDFGKSPLAVFRIPTIRTEYRNSARNPAPGLVAAAVDEIGGDWISLNDIDELEREKIEDGESCPSIPFAEAELGQLSIPTCLDLVSRARCVVTPISFMAWAALAYGAPTLCVWGGYCPPRTIFGPLLDLAPHFKIVAPEVPCACFKPDHECAKSIPIERVKEAARALTSGRG